MNRKYKLMPLVGSIILLGSCHSREISKYNIIRTENTIFQAYLFEDNRKEIKITDSNTGYRIIGRDLDGDGKFDRKGHCLLSGRGYEKHHINKYNLEDLEEIWLDTINIKK